MERCSRRARESCNFACQLPNAPQKLVAVPPRGRERVSENSKRLVQVRHLAAQRGEPLESLFVLLVSAVCAPSLGLAGRPEIVQQLRRNGWAQGSEVKRT
jgi:hypothetical protein